MVELLQKSLFSLNYCSHDEGKFIHLLGGWHHWEIVNEVGYIELCKYTAALLSSIRSWLDASLTAKSPSHHTLQNTDGVHGNGEFRRNKKTKLADRHDLPEELSSGRAHLHQATCQSLSLHHGRWWGKLVTLDQAAGDASRSCALAWWDDDAHPIVAAASHWAAASIHHEAHQEPVESDMAHRWKDEETKRLCPSVITSEDCFHAVRKNSHNQTPERKEANERRGWKVRSWELSPGSLYIKVCDSIRMSERYKSPELYLLLILSSYRLKFFTNCQGRSLNK